MEQWTFIRRLFSRFRQFPRRGSEDLPSVQHGFMTAGCEYKFIRKNSKYGNFQPKSLPEVNYDEILNGARIEDFSADCWLDGHIHRFADAAEILGDQHGHFSSQEDLSSDTISSESYSNTSSPRICDSPRNLLVDLFAPLYESSPPPYSNEPPPTYEEAMNNALNSPDDDGDDDWIWY